MEADNNLAPLCFAFRLALGELMLLGVAKMAALVSVCGPFA